MILDANTINKLRSEYGEAFYLLDSEQFKQNYIELKEAFASIYPHFNIAYSYKTNYTPKLCKIINEFGGYAEVVSEMELELARRCGVEPDRIIWNGPIKDTEEEKRFLLDGGTVNIDSLDEAYYIYDIALHTDKTLRVGVRCNFDVKDGVLSRFGLDVDGDDFETTIKLINETDNIYLVGFQCHFAKRQIDYWADRAHGILSVIEKTEIIPDRIDIGGGLFGKMEESLKAQFTSNIPDYKEYAETVAPIIAEYFKHKEKKPELIIEPGSALVGDCMKFVGTVKSIKKIRGKYIASVLGSQKNISMQGVNPPIQVIPIGSNRVAYKEVDFVGFTCIEGDVIYRNYSGELANGDAIVINNCGSYSLVMKPPFILPNFPVLDICGETTEVIKRKENFDDIFHTFNI